MSKLLLILPRRPEPKPERLPETPSNGDLDLLPGAVILWLGSVARVIAGAPGREAFEGEATAALVCALLIPCWALWSWIRFRHGEKAKRPAGDTSSGIFTKS